MTRADGTSSMEGAGAGLGWPSLDLGRGTGASACAGVSSAGAIGNSRVTAAPSDQGSRRSDRPWTSSPVGVEGAGSLNEVAAAFLRVEAVAFLALRRVGFG